MGLFILKLKRWALEELGEFLHAACLFTGVLVFFAARIFLPSIGIHGAIACGVAAAAALFGVGTLFEKLSDRAHLRVKREEWARSADAAPKHNDLAK